MSSNDRKFEMEITLPASPDQVWAALTDAREVMRWFAPTAEVTPEVGGALVWQWDTHHLWPQTIVTCEPGRHLATRYDSAVDDGQGGKRPLFLDFHLEGDHGSTTLRLVHSGFGPEAEFDAEFDGISGGWPVELRSLRHYLANHRGRDRQIAWSRWSTSQRPTEAWQALVEHGLPIGDLHRLSEGASYSVDVPGAGPISGKALFSPSPREFSGTAQNLENGWFRVHCEHWAGATQVWVWLALYGGDDQTAIAARFERAFDAAVERALPTAERAPKTAAPQSSTPRSGSAPESGASA